ncbi:MAG: ATP-binding protein [Acidimicrobiales bacterium]
MYQNRIVDEELKRRLRTTGAVLIEGPRACGKTATAERAAASKVYLDVDLNAQQAMAIDPTLVLDGPTPRLLDEWQTQPSLWNHVRRAVDQRGEPGQFILTGSAVPADENTRHTGAMRITRLRMRPMSLQESGHSTSAVSLGGLFEGESVRAGDSGLTIKALATLIAIGGWPGLINRNPDDALLAIIGYLDEIARSDLTRVDGIRRDPSKVHLLLRSLARNAATMATASVIAADTSAGDIPLNDDTVRDYLVALGRLMVVENQPAWAPQLRSKSVLRSAHKRHFVDPSLAVAALGASPKSLLHDLRALGFLFESLVLRDLRVYSQAHDATVSHYRDNTGLEVDAIIQRRDGCWIAVEVKLGAGSVEEAATTLKKFEGRIDSTATGALSALVVITGGGLGYVRPDGVRVVPIGVLGP